MIPNIAKNGRSFKGAAAYYLHDKARDPDTPKELKPKTDERVTFIAGRNLVFDDPDQAIEEMIGTFWAQSELKREAGLSAGGRKCTEPVKTISLAWHPDEKPSHDQMIEAADRYLKHMGWNEHQALYIGHEDTAHPHVHIILNRVHPETGRVLDDRLDFKRSQQWALSYEKEMGRIWCEKRLDYDRPAEERPADRAANDNLPHNVLEMARPLRRDYADAEKARHDIFALERDLLKIEQRDERQAWFADGKQLFKDARNAVWREVKEEYREEWKQLYADKQSREEEAEKYASSAIGRALYFAKSGDWEQARSAFDDRNAVHEAVAKEFAERAALLRAEQLAETRERQKAALDALKIERVEGYKELLAHQHEQRQEMREAHAAGERANHLLGQTHAARSANENQPPDAPAPEAANANRSPEADQRTATAGIRARDEASLVVQASTEIAPQLVQETPTSPEERAAARLGDNAITGAADLGAGVMGGAATYIADQLGELFAPTPPEVREAQAKALEQAREDAAARTPENPYRRHAEDANEKIRIEREDRDREEYWDERARRRER